MLMHLMMVMGAEQNAVGFVRLSPERAQSHARYPLCLSDGHARSADANRKMLETRVFASLR